MPRKPAKITRKRPVKAPKRKRKPKTHLVTEATPQRLPAPKTRVTVGTGTNAVEAIRYEFTTLPIVQWCATDPTIPGALAYGNTKEQALEMLEEIRKDLRDNPPKPVVQPSRWSRLWAWLGRLGRP